MDPFSLTLGAVALTGSVLTITSKARNIRANHRTFAEDNHHFEVQRKRLQSNRALLDGLGSNLPDSLLNDLKSSLEDREAAFPNTACLKKKRYKLKWIAFGERQKVQNELTKLEEVESSAIFSLLLTTLGKWAETSNSVNALRRQILERDQKIASCKEQLELFEACARKQIFSNPGTSINQELPALVYYWNWIARLGIGLRLVMAHGDFNIYIILLQLPLFMNMFLTWRFRISRGFPSGIYFKFRLRTEIPSNSPIISACQTNDLDYIRQLLREYPAYVDVVTPDNRTLLCVAICAGHAQVVELLLDHGADANQVFGGNETSALNAAFHLGRADIVRLLLRTNLNTDLEYINKRLWTSVYYLWDPDEPVHSTVSEILDICGNRQFHCWNTRDSFGWAPIHRAASFGKPDHIEKLFNMRLVDPNVVDPSTAPLTTLGWSPMQCAATYGNISTFKYLLGVAKVRGIFSKELPNIKDKRGWNMLHLAARSGSEEMMAFLLANGFDPDIHTNPATLGLRTTLHYKRLKAYDIAAIHGYTIQYNNAMNSHSNLEDSIAAST